VQLGQVMPNRFETFRRPQGAGFYTPGLAPTAFYSHINPFMHVMNPVAAYRPRLPNMPHDMRLNVVGVRRNSPFPTGPGPSPANPSVQQLQGFGGFGHPGGASPFDFIDTDPSRRMRTGAWMNVPTTPGGIRAGVMQAGRFMQMMHPRPYPGAALPAGAY